MSCSKILSSALLATPEVTTLSEVFSEAKTRGNVKYYYIQRDKDHEVGDSSSENAPAATTGFSVLGEVYLAYTYNTASLKTTL